MDNNEIMDEFREISLQNLLDIKCSICNNTLYLSNSKLYTTNPVQIMTCGHKFHNSCLNKSCLNKDKCNCPICLKQFNFNEQLIDLSQFILNGILELFLYTLDDIDLSINQIIPNTIIANKIRNTMNETVLTIPQYYSHQSTNVKTPPGSPPKKGGTKSKQKQKQKNTKRLKY